MEKKSKSFRDEAVRFVRTFLIEEVLMLLIWVLCIGILSVLYTKIYAFDRAAVFCGVGALSAATLIARWIVIFTDILDRKLSNFKWGGVHSLLFWLELQLLFALFLCGWYLFYRRTPMDYFPEPLLSVAFSHACLISCVEHLFVGYKNSPADPRRKGPLYRLMKLLEFYESEGEDEDEVNKSNDDEEARTCDTDEKGKAKRK